MRRHWGWVGLGLVMGAAACGPQRSASVAPEVNPCLDERYVALQSVPLDSMSEREFDFYQQRDAACLEYRNADASRATTAQSADGIAMVLWIGLVMIPVGIWMALAG